MLQNPPLLPCFVELPPFERYRKDYLDDDEYQQLQAMLLQNPEVGDVIRGTGGLRKVRYGDKQRGKGKRSGLRVIYYYWTSGTEFWLFTLYNKDELDDLDSTEQSLFKSLLEAELKKRETNKPNSQPKSR